MRSITRRDSTSSSSSSSSTDSSSNYQIHPPLSLSSLHNHPHDLGNKMKSSFHLPTDLSLGLSLISTTTPNFSPRQQDWPPIKTGMRRALITGTADGESSITIPKSPLSSSKQQRNMMSSDNSLFVKVIMEGIKIGRKIDVLAIHGYPHLVTTLEHMFTTPNILWAGDDQRWNSHVLTYEDQDGDWMMVGDVPWEMFLTTVKRIKITRTFNSSSS